MAVRNRSRTAPVSLPITEFTGPVNSVIGSDTGAVLDRFLTAMPQRLSVAEGPVMLNSVLVDVDPETGRALTISRVDRMVG